jgi:hypothetical protein
VPDPTQNGINRYGGWVPDRPDIQDLPLYPPITPTPQRPVSKPSVTKPNAGPFVGLRNDWQTTVGIIDQQPYESCVSCAITSVIRYFEATGRGIAGFGPSRMFLYYNARALEGTAHNPSIGTGIRSALKAFRRYGVCNEALWPVSEPSTPLPPPGRNVYQRVEYRGLVEYRRIFQLDTRGDIATLDLDPVRRSIDDDLPVICGFTAFPSFLDAYHNGGVVRLPDQGDLDFADADPNPASPADGVVNRVASFGHAAVIIGYQGTEDDDDGTFTLANSWGRGFGNGGLFTMPARYLAHAALAADFWTITSLEAADVSAAVKQSADLLLRSNQEEPAANIAPTA